MEKKNEMISNISYSNMYDMLKDCVRDDRGQVTDMMNTQLKNYVVIGERGEAKKITLPRDLVVWE